MKGSFKYFHTFTEVNNRMNWYLYAVLFVIVLAIAYVIFNYVRIKAMKEGTEEMADLAGIIRSGADQFMKGAGSTYSCRTSETPRSVITRTVPPLREGSQ